jgi:hypothetical protein
VADANANWNGVISRIWQSFADLGPGVAFQLINQGPALTGNPASSSVPAVAVVAAGNPNGSNPAAGGSGFVNQFGQSPIQTFTGPLPAPGSVMSLVYGGSSRSLPVGPGIYAAPTPNPMMGGPRSCASPPGVNANTYGVPVAPASPLADGSGGVLAVLGILALAGLGYWADRESRKRGRAA